MSNLARFIFKAKMEKNVLTPALKPCSSATTYSDAERTCTNETKGDVKAHSVKVCTLFKPLLRRFRSFLRTKFDKGRKPSVYQHWDESAYLDNVRAFMNELRLPSELIDHDNILKILTILFPCSIKKI